MNAPNSTKEKKIHGIVSFLRSDVKSGSLESTARESVEVAIECLETAYGKSCDKPEESGIDIDGAGKDITEGFRKPASSYFQQYEKFLDNYEEAQLQEYASRLLAQPDPHTRAVAEHLKEQGNAAMEQADYLKGLDYYTQAIRLDNSNAVYYGNRAAAFMKLEDYHSAISDCNTAIKIDPDYSKAYARIGMAHTCLDNQEKAKEYYQIALALEPANVSYQNNVKVVDDMLKHVKPPNLPPPFNNPDLFSFAQEMFADPSMNALGRRLAEQLYPEIARQFGGSGDQNMPSPQNPSEKKED